MRPLLHLLSIALLLPGVILATAFMMLGNAIATSSLLGFFKALLQMAVWLIPWGLLAACAALLLLALAGLSIRFRWLAGLCVAALAIGSATTVLALTITHGNFSPSQLAFLAPAFASAPIGVWLGVSEWPRNDAVAMASQSDVA
ncbi:MAG: hypothetical protein ABIQ70_03605 [Dokdonella sp.]